MRHKIHMLAQGEEGDCRGETWPSVEHHQCRNQLTSWAFRWETPRKTSAVSGGLLPNHRARQTPKLRGGLRGEWAQSKSRRRERLGDSKEMWQLSDPEFNSGPGEIARRTWNWNIDRVPFSDFDFWFWLWLWKRMSLFFRNNALKCLGAGRYAVSSSLNLEKVTCVCVCAFRERLEGSEG